MKQIAVRRDRMAQAIRARRDGNIEATPVLGQGQILCATNDYTWPAKASSGIARPRRLSNEATTMSAHTLECVAAHAVDAGSHREAARLFGAASAIRQRIGHVRFQIHQAGYKASVGGAA